MEKQIPLQEFSREAVALCLLRAAASLVSTIRLDVLDTAENQVQVPLLARSLESSPLPKSLQHTPLLYLLREGPASSLSRSGEGRDGAASPVSEANLSPPFSNSGSI